MILYNWTKCTSGNIKYVRRSEKGNSKLDRIAWQMLYDSYLKEYGLKGMYKKTLLLMKEHALLQLEYVITGDRIKLTESEIKLVKLNAMLENGGASVTIDQTLIHLSRWLGTFIDVKSITVRQYFNLIEEYGKANKSK